MSRRKKLSTVIVLDGKPMNMVELAAHTGKSYYLLSDRYHSGDRDEDLLREVGAPRKRKVERKVHARKGLGPFHHAPKRQLNTERAQLEREARERVKAGLVAAFSAPLIAASLLSSEERREIRESVVGRQRWWTADSAYMGTR